MSDCILVYRLFVQGTYWKSMDGRVLKIEGEPSLTEVSDFANGYPGQTLSAMTPAHAKNLMRFLERNAKGYEILYTLGDLEANRSLFERAGDHAQDAIEMELENRSSEPIAWLKTTPLYLALAARAA